MPEEIPTKVKRSGMIENTFPKGKKGTPPTRDRTEDIPMIRVHYSRTLFQLRYWRMPGELY